MNAKPQLYKQRTMTLREFQLIDAQQQAEKLLDAVCIAGRDEADQKVLLYQLDSFYVEVYYHPRRNLITQYKSFDDLDKLDVYLDKVELMGY